MNEEIKKEEKVEKTEKKGFAYQYVAIGLFIVLIVVLGFVVYGNGGQGEVVAKVNGEKITLTELNNLYDTLPPQQKSVVTKNDVLQGLIQSELIYQEAKKQGFSVSKEEAMQDLDSQLVASGLDKEQLLQSLSLQGMTEDEFLDNYIVQLTVQKFLDEKVLSDIEISQQEVRDYYSDNVELFQQGEKVNVKHILVGDEGLDTGQKKAKAEELLKEVNEGNFCEYVTEYTTDEASKLNCGEYSFGKEDPYVQEFKDLSFSQEVGKMGIADTQFGSHIIWTVSKEPEGITDFSEVSSQIEELLKSEIAKGQFEEYYKELEGKNNVKILFEEI